MSVNAESMGEKFDDIFYASLHEIPLVLLFI